MKIVSIIVMLFMLLLSPSTSLPQETCDGNFDCDQDVDGTDAAVFKIDFGRSLILHPCSTESPCNGDFNCDRDCYGTDAARFKQDFGRNSFNTPCPACLAAIETCDYKMAATTCQIEIPLNMPCPGKASARKVLPATCNSVIDFTVCSDCATFDPSCLIWTISPAVPWLSIGQIDDCCWRLTIGDSCEQIEKLATHTITVLDICNDTSDSIEINIGKVIMNLGDAVLPRGAGSASVDINLSNPYHAVRAITMDVAECEGGDDHLICTQCVIDSDRTLKYTCSATEQEDGSCKVVLYSTDPSAVIMPGKGPVARIVYIPGPGLNPCGACVYLCPTDVQMSDQYNEAVCACY